MQNTRTASVLAGVLVLAVVAMVLSAGRLVEDAVDDTPRRVRSAVEHDSPPKRTTRLPVDPPRQNEPTLDRAPAVVLPEAERAKVLNSLDGLADGLSTQLGPLQHPSPPDGWNRPSGIADASRVASLIEQECQCRTEGLVVDCREYPCMLVGPEPVASEGMDWLLDRCIRGCATLKDHGYDPSATNGMSIPGTRGDDGTMQTWSAVVAPMSGPSRAHYASEVDRLEIDPTAYTVQLVIERSRSFFGTR